MFDKMRAISFSFIEAISYTLSVVRATQHQSQAEIGFFKS